MEKQIVLKKGKEVILFVKERDGIKLVNLDLRKHIILNEPIQEIKIRAR